MRRERLRWLWILNSELTRSSGKTRQSDDQGLDNIVMTY